MMGSRNSRQALKLILVCGSLAGCKTPAVPPAGHGVASFRILEPRTVAPKNAKATLDVGQPREVIEPAHPFLPLKTPVFPRAALRGHDHGALVAAHVTVSVN